MEGREAGREGGRESITQWRLSEQKLNETIQRSQILRKEKQPAAIVIPARVRPSAVQ